MHNMLTYVAKIKSKIKSYYTTVAKLIKKAFDLT